MIHIRRFNFATGLLVCFAAVVAGCGGAEERTYPVKGKMTIKGNGPVTKGVVKFTGGMVTAIGVLNENGEYELKSGAQDGCPAGSYKVTIEGAETGGDYDNPDTPVTPLIHSKYSSSATTDLTAEVKEGATFDFELDPPEGS